MDYPVDLNTDITKDYDGALGDSYTPGIDYPESNKVLLERADPIAYPLEDIENLDQQQIVEEEEKDLVSEEPLMICELDKFLCYDGSDCIPQDKLCDGEFNCFDNSDENNCTATTVDTIYDDTGKFN